MKLFICFFGILFLVVGALNLIFFNQIPPIVTIPQSIGLLIVGFVFCLIGREYLFHWLAYLFSGSDSNDG